MVCAPGNPNELHSKGFNLALLGCFFGGLLAEVDNDSYPHFVQQSVRGWLTAAIEIVCNATEIGQAGCFFLCLAPGDLRYGNYRHDPPKS